MKTFDIFQETTTRERWTVDAESFEEALKLHTDSKSTMKDAETTDTGDIKIVDRATGDERSEFDIVISEDDA